MLFIQQVLQEIGNNIQNNYSDNWDNLRFGPKPKMRTSFKQRIINILHKKKYFNLGTLADHSYAISKFEYLFNHLSNEADRDLLVKVLVYRLLGYTKVKLPLNNAEYWKSLQQIEELANKEDTVQSGFLNIPLNRFNLNKIGYPIELYFSSLGIQIDFVIKQYEYNKNGKVIKAEPGDCVIDAGGCWGDTALFFSNEIGTTGKVVTFEFIPNNIQLMKKNFSLNTDLAKNIDIVDKPLWNEAGVKMYFHDNGPASIVKMEPFEGMSGECVTTTIDATVQERKLDKVDFIKMDIEGAELYALNGALETIRKFKPKLAITLYHSVEDFERIPKLIKEIDPNYQFYFSHCTIYNEESLVFAEVVK